LKSKTTTRKWNSEKKEWSVNIFRKGKDARYTRALFQGSGGYKSRRKIRLLIHKKMAKPGKGFAVQEGDKLEIWTDGACSGNPGGGGYAALLKNNGQVKRNCGRFCAYYQ